VAAGFDGHGGGADFEIFEHLPGIGGEEIVFVDPADLAFRGANFNLVLEALEDVETIAKIERADGFADLGGSAPDSDLLIAGVADFERGGGMAEMEIEAETDDEE
jgi:hypothetical protein